jgi:hypothetical protein
LQLSHVDRKHLATIGLRRTCEVRHGYSGTNVEATKIFPKLQARITSLVGESWPAPLPIVCWVTLASESFELEITEHNHRSVPSKHAQYNSYSSLVPPLTPPAGGGSTSPGELRYRKCVELLLSPVRQKSVNARHCQRRSKKFTVPCQRTNFTRNHHMLKTRALPSQWGLGPGC